MSVRSHSAWSPRVLLTFGDLLTLLLCFFIAVLATGPTSQWGGSTLIHNNSKELKIDSSPSSLQASSLEVGTLIAHSSYDRQGSVSFTYQEIVRLQGKDLEHLDQVSATLAMHVREQPSDSMYILRWCAPSHAFLNIVTKIVRAVADKGVLRSQIGIEVLSQCRRGEREEQWISLNREERVGS